MGAKPGFAYWFGGKKIQGTWTWDDGTPWNKDFSGFGTTGSGDYVVWTDGIWSERAKGERSNIAGCICQYSVPVTLRSWVNRDGQGWKPDDMKSVSSALYPDSISFDSMKGLMLTLEWVLDTMVMKFLSICLSCLQFPGTRLITGLLMKTS